jgi:YfiR/HmsC-like
MDPIRLIPTRLLRHIVILVGMMFSLVVTSRGALQAADQPVSEYQVKAAFLLNFTKFVDWPSAALPDDGSPISICILGNDPFGGALDLIVEGETVNARKLVVLRLHRRPAAKACHVLFVAKSEKNVPQLLAGLDPGILTVGEGDNFLREGGMIAFVLESRRVRFDINQKKAESAALKVSSKLLSVARTVEK